MLSSVHSFSKTFPQQVQLTDTTAQKQQAHSISAPLFTQWHRLLSAIKNTDHDQWITLINPPFIPNDRFLESNGLENCYIRIVTLNEDNLSTRKYIQQSMSNGKSTLVAAWLNSDELAREFQDAAHSKCQTLLFCRDRAIGSADPQLELAI